MTDPAPVRQTRWQVGRSISLELDVALSRLNPFSTAKKSDEEEIEFLNRVAPAWRSQWADLLGPPRRWISVLSRLAAAAGVLYEEDYHRATLAMREMTLDRALERIQPMTDPLGLKPNLDLPPAERLIDLSERSSPALFRYLSLPAVAEESMARESAVETAAAIRILRDGDLHTRFWLWLDQFYFEYYRPWREAKLAEMAAQEQMALAALGSLEGVGIPPSLDWLPSQNPLHYRSELTNAAAQGKLKLLFWTQPFGFFDYWNLSATELVVPYIHPHKSMMEFHRDEAEPIAERAKALGDPTRLLILRMIRQFGMDNTQMADYLGLARPTVSIHAKVLREAGLISTRHEGRASVHTLDHGEIRRLFRDIESFLQLPDDEPESHL